ncbi:exonuclease domain-containing protein [Butyrivibrio fibrisolvens]|uniref:exonuclease domain-containing protein n=1 Tax=Butyrivibrio fibrisolvens TaxID=831 RepID=UPI0003B318BF|nr:exonuclease domain-containing protein [Butyrivibrio fibrisolvens]
MEQFEIIRAENIVVEADQVPGKVSFNNFAQLKQYMERGLSVYNTTEYTVDNLKQAEHDLKELRAIKKKLADKKKELETAYSMPIEEVKKQLEELIDMVKIPLDTIDKLIKDNAKKAKEQEIMEYARSHAAVLGEYADKVIGSDNFFNQRWLLASYKTKDWQADIDKIITDSSDAFETIEKVGGNQKAALRAFYFDKLSLDGADKFLQEASSDNEASTSTSVEDEDAVVGYKVLKIYGTDRQMRQLMTELTLSDIEFEEMEDGMPKTMEEITTPDFSSFVCFDIEHTGTMGINKGDAESEIIEIGAVKVRNGEIVDRFDMLANPGRKIVPMISRLTHITDEMVANEPPVEEVIKKFKEFVGNDILVGHNIKSCDIPHISRAAKRAGVKIDNKYLDTKILAKKVKESKGWDKITLPYLAEFYGFEHKEVHRAWSDAEVNARLYFELQKVIQ